MNHNIHLEGVGYRLRPVKIEDGQFIIDVRLEDKERNKFINIISAELRLQEEWIKNYFERKDDYYFVIENKLTGEREGLIGIYDVKKNKAEWGRWVLKKGSLASIESVDLVYKLAFGVLKLDELYSRTISDNFAVVSFHEKLPQKRRGVIEKLVKIEDKLYDAIEHYVTPDYFYKVLQPVLEKKSHLIFQRNFRSLFGKLEFHHIGVATTNIEKEFATYRILGYTRESEVFEDPEQGIRGMFITAEGQPRLELLENLVNSETLNVWIEKRVKMYHFAYKVTNIEKIMDVLNHNRIKTVSPLKQSTYFGKRICFLALTNMYLIELVED